MVPTWCEQELGIPTANISADELGRSLSDAVTGIYYGWARVLPSRKVHAMVASIGYNPFYGNTTKTCEPWLLAQFDQVRTHALDENKGELAGRSLDAPRTMSIMVADSRACSKFSERSMHSRPMPVDACRLNCLTGRFGQSSCHCCPLCRTSMAKSSGFCSAGMSGLKQTSQRWKT